MHRVSNYQQIGNRKKENEKGLNENSPTSPPHPLPLNCGSLKEIDRQKKLNILTEFDQIYSLHISHDHINQVSVYFNTILLKLLSCMLNCISKNV